VHSGASSNTIYSADPTSYATNAGSHLPRHYWIERGHHSRPTYVQQTMRNHDLCGTRQVQLRMGCQIGPPSPFFPKTNCSRCIVSIVSGYVVEEAASPSSGIEQQSWQGPVAPLKQCASLYGRTARSGDQLASPTIHQTVHEQLSHCGSIRSPPTL